MQSIAFEVQGEELILTHMDTLVARSITVIAPNGIFVFNRDEEFTHGERSESTKKGARKDA